MPASRSCEKEERARSGGCGALPARWTTSSVPIRYRGVVHRLSEPFSHFRDSAPSSEARRGRAGNCIWPSAPPARCRTRSSYAHTLLTAVGAGGHSPSDGPGTIQGCTLDGPRVREWTGIAGGSLQRRTEKCYGPVRSASPASVARLFAWRLARYCDNCGQRGQPIATTATRRSTRLLLPPLPEEERR